MIPSVPIMRTRPISASTSSLSPSPSPSPPHYRILSFCPYYPPHLGGLEKFAEELHRLLASHHHQVTVFTAALPPLSSPSALFNNLQVLRYPAIDIIFGYPLPQFWTFRFWQDFKKIDHSSYDIVLSSTRFFLSSLLALVFARVHRLPHLHIEHGSNFVQSKHKLVSLLARLYDETFGRLVLRYATCNISPSRSAQQFIAKFDSRPSPVIHRGVSASDIDAISPLKFPFLHSSQLLIVYAGRLIAAKGVADLIRSCAKLPRSRFHLAVIGDGPEKSSLQSLAAALNLSSHTTFFGSLSHQQTMSVLKSAAICVNPSYNEGLPTILLEAALARCAIVATTVGGTSEIISDRYSGLLYQPADDKALTASLRLLLDDAALRTTLSRHARQSVIQNFNWQHAYNQYVSLFHQYICHDTANP